MTTTLERTLTTSLANLRSDVTLNDLHAVLVLVENLLLLPIWRMVQAEIVRLSPHSNGSHVVTMQNQQGDGRSSRRLPGP